MAIVLQQARRDIPATTSTPTINNGHSASLDSLDARRSDPAVPIKKAQLLDYTYACTPSRTQRHNLNRTLEYRVPEGVINPSSISFPPDSEFPLPPGWEQHVHPEGLPYFVLSQTGHGSIRRVITEEWMYDPTTSKLILDFISLIENANSEPEVVIWHGSDLFLELERFEGKFAEESNCQYCGYYFVHDSSRCIYWPEKVILNRSMSEFLCGTWGNLSQSQKKSCLEAEFWLHWDHFPSLYIVTPDTTNYAVDTIVDLMTDAISAPHDSSTIFSYEELDKMLKLVKMNKEHDTSRWHIGRFMTRLTQDRLRKLGTGLNRSLSVAQIEHEPHSMIFDIFSPFLFFNPHAKLERARTLAVERYIISLQWDSFTNEIQEEWDQASVLATALLAVNWAVLASPLFQDQTLTVVSSPGQISSYLSITTSLFGFILSVDYRRRHRTRKTHLPAELFTYIDETEQKNIDYRRFEHLLLVWSLPHALVLWSTVTFSLALIFMCFSGTLTTIKFVIALSMSLIGLSTFYCLIKFGSGKNLIRIWLRCLYRSMKQLRSRRNHGRGRQNLSDLATLPR